MACRPQPQTFTQGRKALGWTQARCATILGVHRDTVAAWERGRQAIPQSAWLVLRLAQANQANTCLCEAVAE